MKAREQEINSQLQRTATREKEIGRQLHRGRAKEPETMREFYGRVAEIQTTLSGLRKELEDLESWRLRIAGPIIESIEVDT